MAAPIFIIILTIAAFVVGRLLQKRHKQKLILDPKTYSAAMAEARSEAKAQAGAHAGLPQWRTLQPRLDHPFLGPTAWSRLLEWGMTLDRAIDEQHGKEEAAAKLAGGQYGQNLDELKRLEFARARAHIETNARLVTCIRAMHQHDADLKAGPQTDKVFGEQLAQDQLFVDGLRQRVLEAAKMRGWTQEHVDGALTRAREAWAPNASWMTSPSKFIHDVLAEA